MEDEGSRSETVRRAQIRLRRRLIIAGISSLLLGAIGAVAFLFITHSTTDPLAASFRVPQQAVDFPLYYPSALPNYYFVDNGSIQTNNDVTIFPINRNDGKKILVTEQSLPASFDLSGVNGLQHQIPGVGTAVIGSGFLGNRAVIKTPQTVIFLSAPQEITITDLQLITYSFKRLD